MISLGGVQLPSNLIWEDRYGWSPVTQSVKMTLGGRPIVYSAQLQAGRRITLSSSQDMGWVTKEQVDSLMQLADVAGAQYSLTIGSATFDVVFRHEDPPAVEASPLIPRGDPVAGDYFLCRIKLLTV